MLKKAIFFWESEKQKEETRSLVALSQELKEEHEKATSGFERSLDEFAEALRKHQDRKAGP